MMNYIFDEKKEAYKMKENFKLNKELLKGVTHDEVFINIRHIFANVNNGWDIAQTYSKLFAAAQHGGEKTTMFFAVVKLELSDYIHCAKCFTEVKAKAKNSLAEGNGTVEYYKVDFFEDAFLSEIAPIPVSMSERILETVKAYYCTNKDVLDIDTIASLGEQVAYLTNIVKWEDCYTPSQIAALINANELAAACSKTLERVEKEYQETNDEETYKEKYEGIKSRLSSVWLNHPCPQDLMVPTNLREIFNEIFLIS